MDQVFKAIDDPSRRVLLDQLAQRDGQSLGELCECLPSMTRFGVMNHLRVLEAAELVSTRRKGRKKLHFLNPIPIRLIHDRWISKYMEPRANTIAAIKTRLEEGAHTMATPTHVYRAYINAPASTVWQAITDGTQTVQYFYGTRVESDWEVGSTIVYRYPDGSVAADGQVLSVAAPIRLEMTFHARWDPDLAAEGPVREVWLLSEMNGMTELTVEMHDVDVESKTYSEFTGGFPYIISGLKSLVETGAGLPAPS
jgi:uncharacterized protein YndB with AHSA1/START domain/DNA-binding transcriptional ArsR family regulator